VRRPPLSQVMILPGCIRYYLFLYLKSFKYISKLKIFLKKHTLQHEHTNKLKEEIGSRVRVSAL